MTEPWRLACDAFIELARAGRLHQATGAPAPQSVGTGHTPLSAGESEGYAPEDIAHFYVARRTRRWCDITAERLRLAYEDYLRDAIYEGKNVPPKVAAQVGVVSPVGTVPEGASVVPRPDGTMQPVAFSSFAAAQAWLDSIDAEIRRRRGLHLTATGTGTDERYWIVPAHTLPR